MNVQKFGTGQAVRRKEDDALLRGQGRFVADTMPLNTLHGFVLRSPHAHAHFHIEDVAAARAKPGVRLVLTAAELTDVGDLPCQGEFPGITLKVPPYPVLARDTVRHVGDAIAFIVADTLDQARDAAEAIVVNWKPLAPVVGGDVALAEGAARVWPDHPNNIAFESGFGDRAATERAFAQAARVVTLKLRNQRVVANYLETRGVVAEYDAARERITLTLTSQGSHGIRDVLCDDVLRIPSEQLRVVTGDVGGAFGTKFFVYREYVLAAVAARALNRSVAWIGERNEHFLSDAHGRDNITTARLALDADNRFLALEVDFIADMGAYLSLYAPYIPWVGAGMLPGVYDFPTCHIRFRGAYTNTVPVDAFRGAGRPEAAYVIERLVDTAARELNIAPDTLRRRNFIKPSAMPYRTATGKLYDSGDFARHMARAQEVADWKGFGARQRASKRAGRLRGIGLATYIEACGSNGPETAIVRLDPDGAITILIGSQSGGQGHHTAYAQLIADHLALPPERVRVIQGDTDLIETGVGTGGSSSIPCGGASVDGAAHKLADNLKDLAADTLEAGAGDLEFADGSVRVVGTDRAISLAALAGRAGARADRLTATDAFAPEQATFPNGTHIAEVEIESDTGVVHLVNYAVVDDFGVTLNPLLLAGQVHGGTVQGVGQALMEHAVYDPQSGQLLTASLTDYALPRARDIPPITFETCNVPCRTNPLGVKGAGEAGSIGSCPAVINAVSDALWRACGVNHVDMPATPQQIWSIIRDGAKHTITKS